MNACDRFVLQAAWLQRRRRSARRLRDEIVGLILVVAGSALSALMGLVGRSRDPGR